MKQETPAPRFAEHERVRLTRAIIDAGLVVGDPGTVVHDYGQGYGYEIEVGQGDATKVVTVRASDLEACTD